jgi:hypothetical protein
MPRTTLLRKQVTPTGTIQPHAGSTAPEGFLVCDGSIVNIADYPKLYAVIGTSWGHGNEISPGVSDGLTFHLPDLRGRFLRGSTEGMDPAEAAARDPDYASRTPSNAGGAAGDNVGSVQDDRTRRPRGTAFGTSNPGNHNHGGGSHRHSYSRAYTNSSINHWDAYSQGGIAYNTQYTGYSGNIISSDGSHTHSITTGGDDETRPINANVNYVIKAV